MALTEDQIEAFFRKEVKVVSQPVDGSPPRVIVFDPEKYVYHVDDEGGIITLPRGGWNIIDALTPIILKTVPGPIVEIGMGESSEVFAKHAKEFNRTLYSCDLEIGGMFRVFQEPPKLKILMQYHHFRI